MTISNSTGAVGGVVYAADDEGEAVSGLPTPIPVPDLETYLRERRICLSRSIPRLTNFVMFMRADRRTVHPNYLPIRLDFENVSRCNFRCTMCKVSEWPKGQRAADMTLADFKRLLDEQVGLVEIKIQGLGEPTLQRDDFFEMIQYARARHIWVRTTTNASLLHLKDNYRKLVDSGVNEIQISIDGADKDTFESIRRGSSFEQVVENCALINGYCAEKGIERTKMWTVVQKANRHQLPDLVDLAARTGFSSMAFSLNLVDFGIADWRTRNEQVTVMADFTMREARELLRRGENLGVKVAFWSVTSKYHSRSPAGLCPWPFERAYVGSDLRVSPCCVIGDPDVSDMGSAVNGFASVWRGEALNEFRKAHLSGTIPLVCQSCYESDYGGSA
ncbi:MAG: radical SAM protein [Phaeospirillum sp.]|nr:radical SAM protein [Phaeospirillum sp.]